MTPTRAAVCGLLLSTGCVVRTEYAAVAPLTPEVFGVGVVDSPEGSFGITPSVSTLFVSSGVGVTLDGTIPTAKHLDVRLAARPTIASGTVTTCYSGQLFCRLRLARSAFLFTGSGGVRAHGRLGGPFSYGVELGPSVYGLESSPALGAYAAIGASARFSRIQPFAEVRLRGTLVDPLDRAGHWGGVAVGLDVGGAGFTVRPYASASLGHQNVQRSVTTTWLDAGETDISHRTEAATHFRFETGVSFRVHPR